MHKLFLESSKNACIICSREGREESTRSRLTLFNDNFAVGARTLVALASAAVHAAVQLLAALGVAGDLGAASPEGFRLSARAFSEKVRGFA